MFSLTDIFEAKRRRMVNQVKLHQLSTPKAVKLSEEIDHYINLQQKKYHRENFIMYLLERKRAIKLLLSGHLDFSSNESFDNFLSSFQYRFKGFETIEIDISQLSFIDSAGTSGLYKLILTAHDNGIKPSITNSQDSVSNVLNILGFFELVESL
jgi:anti-anti-sigma factor